MILIEISDEVMLLAKTIEQLRVMLCLHLFIRVSISQVSL